MSLDGRVLELLLKWESEQGGSTLEEVCQNAPELLPEVRRYVQDLSALDRLLQTQDGSANSVVGVAPDSSIELRSVLDSFRFHARGGIGEIYLARQKPLYRPVAVKRMAPRPLVSQATRVRFQYEAEITSQLEHPGIVPVYGLGEMEGQPCFAMRFVSGQTMRVAIQELHANTSLPKASLPRMALRHLLQRFVAVCNTVAYAHSRRILHRDLKPENVMLGPFGETLVVDWGLAKRMERGDEAMEHGEGAANSCQETEQGDRMGTPAYMSPEQAAAEPVGYLTDVYGLGAILYAILTNNSPVQETSLHKALASAEHGNITKPRQLISSIPAALEAICLKALQREPSDRYPTPLDLADDIERWLGDEPVKAYVDPWTTSLSRWLRRHRTFVVAATVLLLTASIALGTATTLLAFKQTELISERNNAVTALSKSQKIQKYLVDEILYCAVPGNAPTEAQAGVRYLATRALSRIDESFRDQPDVQAELHLVAGQIHHSLGDLQTAEFECRVSLQGLEAVYGKYSDETLTTKNKLADVLLDRGKLAEAEVILEETLNDRSQLSGITHPMTLVVRHNLAQLRLKQGRLAEAESIARDVLAARQKLLPPDDLTTWSTAHNLASILKADGKLEEAIPLARGAYETRRRLLGSTHPDTLTSANNLATVLQDAGRVKEAEELLRRTIADQGEHGLPEHPNCLAMQNNLATIQLERGETENAAGLLRATLDARCRVSGPTHPDTLTVKHNLAIALDQLGQGDEGASLLAETLDARREQLGSGHPDTLSSMSNLGRMYWKHGKAEHGESILREVISHRQQRSGHESKELASDFLNLGRSLVAIGNVKEGESALRQALKVAITTDKDGLSEIWSRGALGHCLLQMDLTEDAEKEFHVSWSLITRETLKMSKRESLEERLYLAEQLSRLYQKLNNASKQKEWMHRSKELQDEIANLP